MKGLNLALMLTAAIVLLVISMPTCAEPLQKLDSVSGKSAVAIEMAITEFRKNAEQPRIEAYQISVYQKDDVIIVIFEDPNRPLGQRGSSGDEPNFEVELTADGKDVIRSAFVR